MIIGVVLIVMAVVLMAVAWRVVVAAGRQQPQRLDRSEVHAAGSRTWVRSWIRN
ncbi:hypothetical protein GPX89_25420 [Nocardia sp. ET3-3]|uniref:Uncharacterized protein n=1 Tax=Nocardia terrae TaxID=2675851 RepID=A0A7K1V232_9NOCA|nr:hypothetical protein [Nocardia terrae]MVU80577.1 hypothetical protein [Nocardia terrae]